MNDRNAPRLTAGRRMLFGVRMVHKIILRERSPKRAVRRDGTGWTFVVTRLDEEPACVRPVQRIQKPRNG